MFGDFDDDIFDDEERTAKTRCDPVSSLLEREADWFFDDKSASSDEHERWLMLKFAADRLYRRREFEAAGKAYAKCIEACPGRNLGLLRDCIDGAARAFHKAGAEFRAASRKYLEELAAIATCEDHYFSLAAATHVTTGGGSIEALQTLVESEPRSGHLWRALGDVYLGDGKLLAAVSCFVKAASCFRASAHESKDRFREENFSFGTQAESQAKQILSSTKAESQTKRFLSSTKAELQTNELMLSLTNTSCILERMRRFYTMRNDSKRDSTQSFEEFWIPTGRTISGEDEPAG